MSLLWHSCMRVIFLVLFSRLSIILWICIQWPDLTSLGIKTVLWQLHCSNLRLLLKTTSFTFFTEDTPLHIKKKQYNCCNSTNWFAGCKVQQQHQMDVGKMISMGSAFPQTRQQEVTRRIGEKCAMDLRTISIFNGNDFIRMNALGLHYQVPSHTIVRTYIKKSTHLSRSSAYFQRSQILGNLCENCSNYLYQHTTQVYYISINRPIFLPKCYCSGSLHTEKMTTQKSQFASCLWQTPWTWHEIILPLLLSVCHLKCAKPSACM